MSSVVTRGRSWVGEHAVLLFALLVLLYMFTPIFVVVLMSLQRPGEPDRLRVRRVHPRQLANVCERPDSCATRWWLSIQIGLLATGLATLLGIADGVRDGAPLLPRARRRPTC